MMIFGVFFKKEGDSQFPRLEFIIKKYSLKAFKLDSIFNCI